MSRLLLVCLAGAIGTGARYLIGLGTQRMFGEGVPAGTLTVNVIGCFLIAAIMHVGLHTTQLSDTARIALTTGLMGGLTTYSAFNYETTKLAERSWATASGYLAITVVGCLIAGLLGGVAARKLFG